MNIYIKVHQDLRLKKGKITVEKVIYADRQLKMSESKFYHVMNLVKKAIEESIEIDESHDSGQIHYVKKVYEGD